MVITNERSVIPLHIGKRMKQIRNLRGMTQAKVSDGIISASHYSNIEGGRYIPPTETVNLLAERLSVPSSYLLGGTVDDKELTPLLKEYEDLLEIEKVEEATVFLEIHTTQFEYIPSLQQELHFNLLRCLHLFKCDDEATFTKQYEDKIASYIDQESASTLSGFLQKRYNYIAALYHYIHHNHTASIHYQLRTLQLDEDQLTHAKLSFNIALSYFQLYQYREALDFVQKAKEIHLNLHNWTRVAECYNLLAVIHKVLKDFETAKMYITKGLHILDDDTQLTYAILLHNLALIHKEEKQYEQALSIINTSIRLKNAHGSADLFISLRAKADMLIELKDNVSTMVVIEEARNASKTELDCVHLQVIEGKYHLQQGHFSAYEKLTQASLDYYLKQKHWKCLKEISEDFAEYYAKRNQYKKAYTFNRLCILSITNMYKEMM